MLQYIYKIMLQKSHKSVLLNCFFKKILKFVHHADVLILKHPNAFQKILNKITQINNLTLNRCSIITCASGFHLNIIVVQ